MDLWRGIPWMISGNPDILVKDNRKEHCSTSWDVRLRCHIPNFLCALAFRREDGLESLAMGIIPDRAGKCWMLWENTMEQSRKNISRKVD